MSPAIQKRRRRKAGKQMTIQMNGQSTINKFIKFELVAGDEKP